MRLFAPEWRYQDSNFHYFPVLIGDFIQPHIGMNEQSPTYLIQARIPADVWPSLASQITDGTWQIPDYDSVIPMRIIKMR